MRVNNKVSLSGRRGAKPKMYTPHSKLPGTPKKDLTPKKGLGSDDFKLGDIELE